MEMNYLVFCKEDEVHLTSNLFREKVLYDGKIIFLSRMTDNRAKNLDNRTFNNTVTTRCRRKWKSASRISIQVTREYW